MKTEELANSTVPEEVASGFRILKLTFFEILQMSFQLSDFRIFKG